jgi:amino acid adenylation domain-containing protein
MLLTPFLQQCQQQPEVCALREQDRQLSYKQLLQQAQAVAGVLQVRGVRSGDTVAIHLDRGIDAVIAVFGVLLVGACYVPLDLKNPASRLAFIVNDANVVVVLGLGTALDWLEQGLWLELSGCDQDGVFETSIQQPLPTNLAAILYTSGSTGQPRGVAISHGAIAAFANWASDLLGLNPADRIASSAPFFFDLSTFDLYAVLGAGASLHFVPAALNMAPARLTAWLKDNEISGWYTVPSLLAFLTYKGNLQHTPLDSLRFLIFAGEVFPTPALIDLTASLPKTALYNFFGPTETNVCCYWPVDSQRLQADKTIPIGMPAADCQLHIDGETGELWVRGSTLASGYWRDGRVQPFLNQQGWYATGDRASLDGDEYRFHGRLGRMLKCSGYRVEPAEIEAVVSAIVGVKACAVVGVDDLTAGQRPALIVVAEPETTVAEIRKALSRQLPAYMQPSRYLLQEALPQLANGKLDYQRLRQLLDENPATGV